MAGRPRKNADAAAEPKAKKETAKKETTAKRGPKKAANVAFKFELTNEQAKNAETVAVAGDFNNWNKEANPMNKTLNGFELELSLEKGKTYQFRYVLNGTEWINDPYRATVDNGMGEQNSVLDASL